MNLTGKQYSSFSIHCFRLQQLHNIASITILYYIHNHSVSFNYSIPICFLFYMYMYEIRFIVWRHPLREIYLRSIDRRLFIFAYLFKKTHTHTVFLLAFKGILVDTAEWWTTRNKSWCEHHKTLHYFVDYSEISQNN